MLTSFSSQGLASATLRAMLASLPALILIGCEQQAKVDLEAAPERAPRYEASIVRTTYGIPHITAQDWGSLGFGEAYASAEDHVCNMALALLQARGESALAFGAGDQGENLARDIVIKALDIPGRAPAALDEQEPDIRDWILGYTAGYNQFLTEHVDGVGSWCNDADWVRPVRADEFMAQYLMLVQTLPRVPQAITGAALPDPSQAVTGIETPRPAVPALASTLDGLALRGMGSNAWALAGARTENGRGLLLANPHYPWYGIARFWEKHLTIPGEYNVYGASLVGTPGIAIGFNEHVGWSHTVSNSKRTVLYQLTLNPENPMQYRWEDGWRELSAKTVSVDVREGQELKTITHTIWFSHHGPLMALPGLSDDPYTVFAVRDANADNITTLAQWKAMGQASGMDDFIDAHRTYNALPWVNTIAASASGRAVYIDNSTVGALRPEAIATWKDQLSASPKLRYLYLADGLFLLDGSAAANDWLATDAPVPFTEPFDRRPLIESEHYVFNSNDSYWLSDPARPAEAVSPLYGPVNSPRSVRTRMNMELLRPDSPRGYAGEDGKFSIEEVQQALFANDSLTADLLLPGLLAACAKDPKRSVGETVVNLEDACRVLSAWDRTFNLSSRGAVLFREWVTRYPYTDTYLGAGLFAQPFDPASAWDTPRGLANPENALNRLAEAVALLTRAGIALDVPLGDLQKGHRADQVFALHGGDRHEGIANLQVAARKGREPTGLPTFTGSTEYVGDSESLSTSGYNIHHGSSFIMTLSYTDTGPEAEAILSYSQAGDPASPHFADQTKLYRDRQWRRILFSPEAIAAHIEASKTVVSSSPGS